MNTVAISVSLLGPVHVEVGRRPVGGFRSHKTLALLAYLIVERRAVARNYLAELLWPDAPTADGRGHVRRALHDLSQKIPNALLIDYHTVQFNPAFLGHSDLTRFEGLCWRTDVDALQECAALCRGEFVEGVILDDCPVFETWLTAERETWRRKAADVLERLLQHYLATPRFDLALEVAWRLLRMEPWQETHYQRLLVLLSRSGNFGLATKVYRRYLAMIADLNVEPSNEMSALYERVCRTRARHPGNLPQGLTPFVGRGHELALLARYLADPACRLICLSGPGGIGKTRLAVEAARRANQPGGYLFLDGSFLVRLEGVTTPDLFWRQIAQAIGMISGGRSITPEMVLRHLHSREALLVLDDVDPLSGHPELLSFLLEDAPGLKLLITCQERVKLPGAWNLPLGGLSVIEGDVWSSEAWLLLQKCLLRHGQYPLSARQREVAALVCQMVGGMPLAIELAASWISTASHDYMAHDLERNLDALLWDDREQTRHSGVRAALDYTWNRLQPEERESLQLLAVFPATFSAHAAHSLTGVMPSQLSALIDRSLVTVVGGGGETEPAQYELHALVRKYAASQATAGPAIAERLQQVTPAVLDASPSARERLSYFSAVTLQPHPLVHNEQCVV